MKLKNLGDALTLAIPAYFGKPHVVHFIISYALANAICFLVKGFTYAPRPNANAGKYVRWKFSLNDGESFPSGHTTSAMHGAVYTAFLYLPIGVPLILLASLCGYTRLKVKAHYDRDVFFGTLIAMFAVGAIYWNIFGISYLDKV
jgi:membrane-associated phospholipid phosphatase